MKYIEMLRRTRVTSNKVSKFKNPQIISWHLARETNGEPTFSVGLFKDNEWIHSGAYGWKEIYGYNPLIELLTRIHQTLGIPINRFFMKGSMTYKDETIRDAIASQLTHEKRSTEVEE
jgi:hypothetical protein